MDIRILLVEDDEHICNAVKVFLSGAGYKVDACFNGDEAHTKFYDNTYQLVILDILLPGMNGHELLREFRKLNNTPVLMMTALSDDENQIRAFDAEADDYVTKPFKIQLLLKRVEALLRRSGAVAKELHYGKLTLLPEDFKVFYGDEELLLTLKEFEILMLLVQKTEKHYLMKLFCPACGATILTVMAAPCILTLKTYGRSYRIISSKQYAEWATDWRKLHEKEWDIC